MATKNRMGTSKYLKKSIWSYLCPEPWNNYMRKNKLLSSSYQSEEFEYTNIDCCPLENIETIKLT